ncbi:hypothetical protein Y1Q_0022919 [Alligator mississippiensis]|uniref:Uncharacterized protein n=1 Tax=Alligator mississippiensis TaxID=8496 RepID=A0A151MHZ6_ALLMI|nr:hypothetical protein Y1Q_0022919 [Alligator mississippiensis]
MVRSAVGPAKAGFPITSSGGLGDTRGVGTALVHDLVKPGRGRRVDFLSLAETGNPLILFHPEREQNSLDLEGWALWVPVLEDSLLGRPRSPAPKLDLPSGFKPGLLSRGLFSFSRGLYFPVRQARRVREGMKTPLLA